MVEIVSILTLFLYKIFTLYIGYLIVKLGHDLLIKGIVGEFKFKSDLKGYKADLVSVSPGIFFVFLAVALMIVAVVDDDEFSYSRPADVKGKDSKVIYPNNPNKKTTINH